MGLSSLRRVSMASRRPLPINIKQDRIIFDNTQKPQIVAEGLGQLDLNINNAYIWSKISNG